MISSVHNLFMLSCSLYIDLSSKAIIVLLWTIVIIIGKIQIWSLINLIHLSVRLNHIIYNMADCFYFPCELHRLSRLKFALFCNNLKIIKIYHISASSFAIRYTIACFSQYFFFRIFRKLCKGLCNLIVFMINWSKTVKLLMIVNQTNSTQQLPRPKVAAAIREDFLNIEHLKEILFFFFIMIKS